MTVTVLLLLAVPLEDPTANRLNAAKGAYEREMELLRPLTFEWFDREQAARQGDRRALSELNGSRKQFDKNFEPPPGLDPAIKKRFQSAANWLESCYDAAAREYRAANELDKASATMMEWQEFRIDGRGTMQPEIRDGQPHLIIARCSKMALTVDPGPPEGSGLVQRPVIEADETQHWLVKKRTSGAIPTFSFQNRKHRLWMKLGVWPHPNGTPMILGNGDGTARNEKWIPFQKGAWLQFQSADSGIMMAIPEGNPHTGTRVIQWERTEEDAQRFRILPIRTPPK